MRAFYLRQRDGLLRFLRRRTRDFSLAEDIAQETWIRLDQAGCAAIDNPRAYMFRIAANLAIDHARASDRRLATAEIEAALDIADSAPDPERIALDRSELRDLARRMEALPERQHRILIMSRVQNQPHRAIAAHFGISTRMVEFELRRALIACRDGDKK